MKLPTLVAIDAGPGEFAGLFAAARAAAVRVGWLDLSAAAPVSVSSELEGAAGLGAMRAVAAAGGRVVSVKPVAGPPVPRDLVREHFLGCALVLVRGLDGWPRLEPAGDEYLLHTGAQRSVRRDAATLIAELRRPRYRPASRRR